MKHLLALDQGTTSSRAIVFDGGGRHRGHGPEGTAADSTRSRAGSSTTPRRSGATSSPSRGRRWPVPGWTPPRSPPSASPTSARPTVLWDRAHGPPAPQRHRLAGPAHGGRLREAEGRQAPRRRSGRKPGWCSTPTSRPPSSPGCSTTCPAPASGRDAASWPSAPSTPGSPGTSPAGRLHVTDAINASRTSLFNIHTRRLGRRAAGAVRHSARAAAARRPLERAVRRDRPRSVRRDAFPSPAWPATSRRRCSARPATARAWRRTPMAPAASC